MHVDEVAAARRVKNEKGRGEISRRRLPVGAQRTFKRTVYLVDAVVERAAEPVY